MLFIFFIFCTVPQHPLIDDEALSADDSDLPNFPPIQSPTTSPQRSLDYILTSPIQPTVYTVHLDEICPGKRQRRISTDDLESVRIQLFSNEYPLRGPSGPRRISKMLKPPLPQTLPERTISFVLVIISKQKLYVSYNHTIGRKTTCRTSFGTS